MLFISSAFYHSQTACRKWLPTQPCLNLRHLAPTSFSQCRRTICTRRSVVQAARGDDEVEPVPPAMLSRLSSDEEAEAEAAWVASMVQCWADEEWPAQELFSVHASLGAATGQAYLRVRQQEGMEEMGDLVLSLSTELMTAFDFYPTFTSPFQVSNKVVELLMLRSGCDVCCTSDSDRTAIQRYEAQLAGQASGAEQS